MCRYGFDIHDSTFGGTGMTQISGTIITYNEEDHIEACIASLRQVCDEIIVVDSLSTDRTVELAKAAGARVISRLSR